ncbi:MAG TPA: hypothetical protein VHC42_02755 [Rhizomicrobium sp.]|nr:hypothetical protein [Rhizomicrobium sp.]
MGKFGCAFAALAFCASTAQAAPYAAMAPDAQYMMDRDAEIALAKSAAPSSISGKATILALTPHGYEVAVKGKNGFVCAVERGWMAQYDFREFWNLNLRGPLCYNPAAARSILPYTIERTRLALLGRSKAQMSAAIKDEIAKRKLPALEAGAVTYMMSKRQYLNDKARRWIPHLMFYFPRGPRANWGADMSGSPLMLNPQFQDTPESISVIMVPAGHWSDGSPAPQMR